MHKICARKCMLQGAGGLRRLTTASNRPGSCLLPQPELAGVQHRRGATHGALPLHKVLPLELCSAGNGGRRGLQKGRPSSGLAGGNHWRNSSLEGGWDPTIACGGEEGTIPSQQPNHPPRTLSKVGRHSQHTTNAQHCQPRTHCV